MKLHVRESIYREVSFKEGTTKEQILQFIETNGIANIYNAEFYEYNEFLLDTADEISLEENDGYSTIEMIDENCKTIYSNGKN